MRGIRNISIERPGTSEGRHATVHPRRQVGGCLWEIGKQGNEVQMSTDDYPPATSSKSEPGVNLKRVTGIAKERE